VKLNFFPRVKIVHTSKEVEGQIYIPEVNYALMILVIIVVIAFKTSTALASAYGVAVCFDMFTTTVFFINVMISLWGTAWWKIVAYAVVFVIVDGAYLASNLRKVPSGGWLPLTIAVIMAIMMVIWHNGRSMLVQAVKEQGLQLKELTESITDKSTQRVSGTGLFFTAEATVIPSVVKQLIRRLHSLPKRSVFLHIRVVEVPFVLPTYPYSTALDIEDLGDGLYFARATYGYATAKIIVKTVADDILNLIDRLEIEKRKQEEVSYLFENNKNDKVVEDTSNVTYFVGRDMVVSKGGSGSFHRFIVKAYTVLSENSRDISNFYNIPPPDLIEFGFKFVA